MSKIIDEDYLIEQLLDKALKIGGDTPILHDIGEAKCFIKCILRCFNELGYEIIQKIEFFKDKHMVNI